MFLIEENALGFDWGKDTKSYPGKNAPFAADVLTERPEAAGTDTPWI